jgi:hypothetical protein
MLKTLHERRSVQLVLGLVVGILFGFLLQKGGATKYHIILGQLLLNDFTVVKIMLSAVVTGMLGVHLLRSLGLVQLHPKPGSIGASVIGGLIFGAGFAVLGYCPGTIAGAVGQGSADSLMGGVSGMLLGSWIFTVAYPRLQKKILIKGDFGEPTLPELLKVNAWVVALPTAIVLVALLMVMEKAGL